jgi:hypothetical protein
MFIQSQLRIKANGAKPVVTVVDRFLQFRSFICALDLWSLATIGTQEISALGFAAYMSDSES